MDAVKNMISKRASDQDLINEFVLNLKNEKFKNLCDAIPCSEKVLSKYTSLLKDSSVEYNNCKNCKGLKNCKNTLTGYVYFPSVNEDVLNFSYVPCKYKKKELKDSSYKKNVKLYDIPTSLKDAKIKEIYTDDEKRLPIIKYINNYYNNFFENKDKGLYLYGSFGSGKTYIIAALFNELAKRDVESTIIYFPEFLRTLKGSFSKDDTASYNERFTFVKKTPLLLIDDIGAENVTPWGRDEILGTILQYRMEENLPTFFTSNMSIDELEEHLSFSGTKSEKLKARRIIERIRSLTTSLELTSIDRRNLK